MPLKGWLLATTALSAFGVSWVIVPSNSASAADEPPVPKIPKTADWTLPAVSVLNGKFDLYGGSRFDESFYGASGALSVPLGTRFGFQLDGIFGSWNGSGFYGAAGHLFWRDPNTGLLGVYASFARTNQVGNFDRVAFEGELYRGPLSIEVLFGWEGGDVPGRFFDMADLVYYWNDNVRLSIGHRYTLERHVLALGTEWQLPLQNNIGTSLFLEGRLGERDYRAIWGGVRFYFGAGDKSLIRRHREDDPRVRLPEDVGLIASPPPPPPPPPPPD